mmetsp:Transcript_16561/g.41509  ORF Transcript_16561/g.41509 Transcript_16561/m.41509 type:complete len:200 (+) Transcript_16561:843-1442(+)
MERQYQLVVRTGNLQLARDPLSTQGTNCHGRKQVCSHNHNLRPGQSRHGHQPRGEPTERKHSGRAGNRVCKPANHQFPKQRTDGNFASCGHKTGTHQGLVALEQPVYRNTSRQIRHDEQSAPAESFRQSIGRIDSQGLGNQSDQAPNSGGESQSFERKLSGSHQNDSPARIVFGRKRIRRTTSGIARGNDIFVGSQYWK